MGRLQKHVCADPEPALSILIAADVAPALPAFGMGLDRIAQLGATALDAAMVAICLPCGNRHWLNGRAEPQTGGALLAQDFFDDAIEQRAILSVDDARFDPRLSRLMEVEKPPRLRAFAAAPLFTLEGRRLGVLCVARAGSTPFSERDLRLLAELAALTVVQYELRLTASGRDPGSQLPNRAQFLEDVDLLHTTDRGRPHVCILIDLADLRYIRDVTRALGAARLEAIIRHAVAMVAGVLQPGQRLYHVDAARFALLTRRAARADWQSLVERLVAAMRSGAATSRFPFLMEAAIGVAPFQPRQRHTADLLRIASIAAEAARGTSRGWALHDPAVDEAHQRAFRLLTDLHPVLHGTQDEPSRQLSLHYQPRINLETGECVGAEALLRWTHPELGAIGPAEFIPLAERTSLPRALTEWVMEHALAQLARWQADGLKLHLAVNISAVNLQEPDFAKRTAAKLLHHGVPADWLTLEFTETALLADTACGSQQLEALAALGLTLAIDDYGTGYGNLSYLQRVPANVLKLDRSFISPLPGSQRDRAIVRNTIRMAHELGYRVVAEGVEETAVSQLLREWGCDEAQGYLFGRPLPSAGFLAFLHERVGERAASR